MQEGVEVEPSKNQKDELQLWGNSLENVSQSAADIQQICRVRNKDIRKVRTYTHKIRFSGSIISIWCLGSGIWKGFSLTCGNSSWTVCTFRRRVTLLRNRERSLGCFPCILDGREHTGLLCMIGSKVLRMKCLRINKISMISNR